MRSLLIALAALAAAHLGAATSSTDLGGVFNDIGVGTRPLGMGGAFTAIADDANAAQENPAGMAFFASKDRYGTFTHSDLFSLGFLSRDFVAYAQGDQGWGALGLSWNRLSADLNPNQWSEDEFVYSGAKLVYGLDADTWPKVAVGWQLKYLRVDSDLTTDNVGGTTVGGGTASGYGSGLGALVKLRPNLNVGLMIQDLYSSLSWATGTIEEVPMNARLGGAYQITESSTVSAELRGQQGSSGLDIASWHIGTEHWFLDGKELHWNLLKNVGARAGYYNILDNQDGGTLTVGATVKSDLWELDYTYEFGLSSSNELGNTQRFGLGINF